MTTENNLLNYAYSAVRADEENIKAISFIPTQTQVHDLITQSVLAEEDRQAVANGNAKIDDMPLLTKMAACFPKSCNPNDTILCKLGSGKISPSAPYVPKNLPDRPSIVVIGNTTMSLGSTSNGPNCVLTDCHNEYGKNIINLFNHDLNSTNKLLIDVINMTNNYKNEIFDLFVDMLINHQTINHAIKNTDPAGEKLDKEYIIHYDNVVEMMKSIRENGGPNKYGLEILRYCQTWLRGGRSAKVGNANFSIPSPHFQLRYYANNANKLANIPGIKTYHLESYCKLINRFTLLMIPEYGGEHSGPAFINLNGLHSLLKVPEFN